MIRKLAVSDYYYWHAYQIFLLALPQEVVNAQVCSHEVAGNSTFQGACRLNSELHCSHYNIQLLLRRQFSSDKHAFILHMTVPFYLI